MPIVFALLSLLIVLLPVLVIRDGLVTQSFSAALTALMLAAAGVAARAADVQFAAQVTRRLGLAAAIPAIWMIVQLLPMPFPEFAHTIWINGNEALNQKAWGHISIDLGRTIEALAFYLAGIALILASVLVARDHQRAGRLLILLGTITVLTVIALLADRFFHLFVFALGDPQEVLGAASALGLVLSLAAAVAGLERRESRRGTRDKPAASARTVLFAGSAGALVCAAGLALGASTNVAIVAAFGVATFASIQIIRRAGRAGAMVILLATLLAAAAMVIVWRFDSDRAISPLLQFASAASADATAVAQRLLSDTGWLGTGAGSYPVLLPVYREFGSVATQAPSTAAALAVELGLPMALAIIAIGVWLIITLYRGALSRGRDSFYAAAAASGAVVLLGQAFCDASLLHAGVAVIGSTLIGVGLAQSVSRAEMA